MSPGDRGSAPAVRLWWAAPLALVVVTAVVFVAVVLPALAGGAHVPAQLVVHRSPSSAAPTQTPTHPHPTASPAPTHSTTVVRPAQPVVRESSDGNDDRGGQGSGEPTDQ